jgi:(4S)-4-hydroxy-5-phosphonooxypentane-2,3-dione isomerase
MHVTLVHVHVKRECVEAFAAATRENAENSLKEPGVARFDVLQNEEEPNRFMLAEAYLTPEAILAHKTTPHYLKWRDLVAPMMADARKGVKYVGIFPGADGWRVPG